MTPGRRWIVVLASAAVVAGLAPPATAARSRAVEEKRVKGVDGRAGTVTRFAERADGRARNSVTMTATDADGKGGRCTETWVDYRTRPHRHFNPGVFVNCAGGTRRVSGAVDNDYPGVFGMSMVVCAVPETSGRISRNEKNCRGALSAIDLHSGKRYDDFAVDAAQFPSGVRIWRR